MKKSKVSQLFLYRHRFVIGYSLLGLAFVLLLVLLPLSTPEGLSDAEMASAVTSANLDFSSISSGDLVDLPYHFLQKLSIDLFGLSVFALRLPSILFGLGTGLLFVLLLNRWFKNNVALLASVISILSTAFLYISGTGTPLIMLVFWPVLLLWLGSKIQGKNHPKPAYCFVFAFALLLAAFTPHLIYLVFFIAIFVFFNPHLRFTVVSLPKVPLLASCAIMAAGLGALVTNMLSNSAVATQLLFADGNFWNNIKTGFLPFFAWGGGLEGTLLAPLIGLPAFALAVIGLISTAHGFFASRNAIASCLIVFTVLITGLSADSAILLILPLTILLAHGLRYVLESWYGFFPRNPYARIFALFPLTLLIGTIVGTDVSHYFYGYRYSPIVANQFSTDLNLVRSNLLDQPTTLIVADNTPAQEFYAILARQSDNLTVVDSAASASGRVAVLGRTFGSLSDANASAATLSKIITSPKSTNSDRIYLYDVTAVASQDINPAGSDAASSETSAEAAPAE